MRIFLENLVTFEQFFFLSREEIFANLIQTITSEARVLNPKSCGVQGCRIGGGQSPLQKKQGERLGGRNLQ